VADNEERIGPTGIQAGEPAALWYTTAPKLPGDWFKLLVLTVESVAKNVLLLVELFTVIYELHHKFQSPGGKARLVIPLVLPFDSGI